VQHPLERVPVGRLRVWQVPSTGAVLAWLAWSVVLTNVAENVGLFVAFTSGPVDPWPLVVAAGHYWASLVIAASLLFIVVGAFAGAG
jgi:hypothetical protein